MYFERSRDGRQRARRRRRSLAFRSVVCGKRPFSACLSLRCTLNARRTILNVSSSVVVGGDVDSGRSVLGFCLLVSSTHTFDIWRTQFTPFMDKAVLATCTFGYNIL